MELPARHAQVLQDQIRHGFATRQPYKVPAAQRLYLEQIGALDGNRPHALGHLARQDRIRLRALCAALRALRYVDEIDPISGWNYGETRLSRR